MKMHAARSVSTSGASQRRPARRAESQQHDQRVLEQIVVERPEKLRAEEGSKATGFEQVELGTHTVFLSKKARVSKMAGAKR